LADDEVQPLADDEVQPLVDPLADVWSPISDDIGRPIDPLADPLADEDIAVGSPLHFPATHRTQAKHWAKHGTGHALGQTT
jgi:hypothetical protein